MTADLQLINIDYTDALEAHINIVSKIFTEHKQDDTNIKLFDHIKHRVRVLKNVTTISDYKHIVSTLNNLTSTGCKSVTIKDVSKHIMHQACTISAIDVNGCIELHDAYLAEGIPVDKILKELSRMRLKLEEAKSLCVDGELSKEKISRLVEIMTDAPYFVDLVE